jgi:hypothetical protein
MVYYLLKKRMTRPDILKRDWHSDGRKFRMTWFATVQRIVTKRRGLLKCMSMHPMWHTRVLNTSTTLAEGLSSRK